MARSPHGMPATTILRLAACPLRLLGPYGCEWIETPNLDRLAARGTVFDAHFASGDIAHDSYAGRTIPFDDWDGETLADGVTVFDWDAFAGNDFPDGEFDAWQALMQAWDESLATFVDLADRATVVFTAKTGLSLPPVRDRLFEERVHLPLIVSHPDGRFAGRRIAGLTDHRVRYDGESVEELPEIVTFDDREFALRTADSCLLLPRDGVDLPTLLFDKPDDRFEINDVAARQPDRVDALRERIAAIMAKWG
jgi:hypothetical protein